MNHNNQDDFDKQIREAKQKIDKLIKEYYRQRTIASLVLGAIYLTTVVGIIVVVNKLDESQPKE